MALPPQQGAPEPLAGHLRPSASPDACSILEGLDNPISCDEGNSRVYLPPVAVTHLKGG